MNGQVRTETNLTLDFCAGRFTLSYARDGVSGSVGGGASSSVNGVTEHAATRVYIRSTEIRADTPSGPVLSTSLDVSSKTSPQLGSCEARKTLFKEQRRQLR